MKSEFIQEQNRREENSSWGQSGSLQGSFQHFPSLNLPEFISSGSHNKIPWAGWLKQQIYFLQVQDREPAGLVSREDSGRGLQMQPCVSSNGFSLCPRGQSEHTQLSSLGSLPTKTVIPPIRTSPSGLHVTLIIPHEDPVSKYSHVGGGVWASTREFWGCGADTISP